MKAALLAAAAKLSDTRLIRQLTGLAAHERGATVELIAHLAEFDKRKLCRGEGYSSTFRYCVGVLRLSGPATYKRIRAARACRRFPMLLDRLAEGSLNPTTLGLLAPLLTRENLEAVVSEASGRSKREVEAIVARLSPKPDVPGSVRKLPVSAVTTMTIPAPHANGRTGTAPSSAPPSDTGRAPTLVASPLKAPSQDQLASAFVSPAPPAPIIYPGAAPFPTPPQAVAPLSPGRYRFQFTAGDETHELFRQVQTLLCREIANGDVAAIFHRALELLHDDVARRKLAATTSPRPRRDKHNPRSRYRPAELIRAVWKRDGGQCAFVAGNGRRCDERRFLEFHHLVPYANGGEMAEDNISLRCSSHNKYEAELAFGPVPRAQEAGAPYTASNGPHRSREATTWVQLSPGTVSVTHDPC
jgi:hypothetical protein